MAPEPLFHHKFALAVFNDSPNFMSQPTVLFQHPLLTFLAFVLASVTAFLALSFNPLYCLKVWLAALFLGTK